MTMDMQVSNNAKYTLRTKSLLKRIESERSREEIKQKEPKEKQKPPPLSKYRRKTANARERSRMREINEAFETLQKTLPDLPGIDADKLTKITVLKLAVNYIKILSHVNDGEIVGDKDIEELRKMWCNNNAHMASAEHCIRPVFRNHKILKASPKLSNSKSKPTKLKISKPFNQIPSLNCKIPKKRPTKSRIRAKVCKTASVATSNGAYITLKNVAFQTTPNRRTHLDNKPLMMSMTVKRPRINDNRFYKPAKISRYEPPIPQKRAPPASTKFSSQPFSNIYNKSSVPPLTIPNLSTATDLSSFTFYDLPNKNLRLFSNESEGLDYSKNSCPCSFESESFDFNKILRQSFCQTENLVGSSLPQIYSTKSLPTSTNEASYPFSNLKVNSSFSSTCSSDSCDEAFYSSPIPLISPSDSLLNASSSDSETDISASLELDNLLGPEAFEEHLEDLTSSFRDADDTLNLFLGHSLSIPFSSDFGNNQENICSSLSR